MITDLGGGQYRVVFAFKAPADIRTVHLAGTFNGWNPHARIMNGPDDQGIFRAGLTLGKGRYEYKFVLDGQTWITDPDNPHRTAGYQNAILFLGIDAPDDAGEKSSPPRPVEMAGEVEHPEPIKQLVKLLNTPEADDGSGKNIDAWHVALEKIIARRMPLFTDGSVTFIHSDDRAESVSVRIAAYGSRTGYPMHRLAKGKPVFAVTLDRAKLPERMAYTFDVVRNGHTEMVVDPLAWSLTSRSGRPAALAVEASDRRGRIEVVRDFKPSSDDLRPRDVYVYLPPGYDKKADIRYPVLYMHDGQNCWDDPTEPFGHGGWCVNLTADRLITTGKVEPFIAVGIANTPERMTEYGIRVGGELSHIASNPYVLFLKRDVKPLIDGKYRTLPGAGHTALMGSSMGGVISLQAALSHPGVFGMAACLSPAFGFDEGSERTYADLVKKAGKVPVRLYVDSGTGGKYQDGAPLTRAMVKLLHDTGWKDGENLMHFEDAGANHNERAWRARLDKPLIFLFGR